MPLPEKEVVSRYCAQFSSEYLRSRASQTKAIGDRVGSPYQLTAKALLATMRRAAATAVKCTECICASEIVVLVDGIRFYGVSQR